jgi:hypothetical protein
MLRRSCLEPARVRARMRLGCGSSRGHEPDSNPASSRADLRPLKVLSPYPLADLATGRGGNARWAFADSSSRHRPHQNAASRAASGPREHRHLIGPIFEPWRCHRSAHLRPGRCPGETPSAHFAPSPLIREGRTSWGESRCRVPATFAACAMAQGPPRCAAVLLDASNVARSGRLWIRLWNLPLGWKRRIAEPTPNHPRRRVRPSRTASVLTARRWSLRAKQSAACWDSPRSEWQQSHSLTPALSRGERGCGGDRRQVLSVATVHSVAGSPVACKSKTEVRIGADGAHHLQFLGMRLSKGRVKRMRESTYRRPLKPSKTSLAATRIEQNAGTMPAPSDLAPRFLSSENFCKSLKIKWSGR